MATVEEIQKRRAERKAGLEADRQAQLAKDLEAIDACEVAHGDTNVAAIEFHFVPGLPCMAAVRTPDPDEIARYRTKMKPKVDRKGNIIPADANEAAAQLGRSCLIYPDAETFARVLEARPGIEVPLGQAAAGLASASEEEQGKG